MTEVKKGNWWSRKTTGQKVAFIIGAILLAFFIATFLFLMNARAYIGDELADAIYGKDVPNGWVAVGHAIVNGSINWLVSLFIIIGCIIVIFVSNFITHLFDTRSRKAKTISSLIRSLIKYIAIIATICIILVIWGVDVIGIVAGVGV